MKRQSGASFAVLLLLIVFTGVQERYRVDAVVDSGQSPYVDPRATESTRRPVIEREPMLHLTPEYELEGDDGA